MSDSEKTLPSVTDSPWFWVMLFSLAGLAALFTIGPKFERREASIEEKFHARERGLGREAIDAASGDAAPTATDAPANQQNSAPPWQPIFTLTPIAFVLAAIAIVAMFNVLRFHRRRLNHLLRLNVGK
ncbi:MAG TPA: hypothetical protein VFE46_10170 [Pirellulales bacterium]|jgi:hypothetical protein|nr:hypothetical protein [Pirellulales bacterium]